MWFSTFDFHVRIYFWDHKHHENWNHLKKWFLCCDGKRDFFMNFYFTIFPPNLFSISRPPVWQIPIASPATDFLSLEIPAEKNGKPHWCKKFVWFSRVANSRFFYILNLGACRKRLFDLYIELRLISNGLTLEISNKNDQLSWAKQGHCSISKPKSIEVSVCVFFCGRKRSVIAKTL